MRAHHAKTLSALTSLGPRVWYVLDGSVLTEVAQAAVFPDFKTARFSVRFELKQAYLQFKFFFTI